MNTRTKLMIEPEVLVSGAIVLWAESQGELNWSNLLLSLHLSLSQTAMCNNSIILLYDLSEYTSCWSYQSTVVAGPIRVH